MLKKLQSGTWSTPASTGPNNTTGLAPAAAAAGNQVCVLWRAANSTVYCAKSNGGAFSSTQINSTMKCTDTPSGMGFGGALFVAAPGPGTEVLWTASTASTWPNPVSIMAQGTSVVRVVTGLFNNVSQFNNQAFIFASDENGHGAISYCNSVGGWGGWAPIPSNYTFDNAPAITEWAGTVTMFMHAPGTNTINWIFAPDGVNWSDAGPVPVSNATGSRPATCVYKEKLYLFYRVDNTVWYCSNDVLSWTGPFQVDGVQTAHGIAATVYNGMIYLFWRDYTSGQVYYSTYSD